MIVLGMKQGSPEWREARLGIPTASNFHRILSPSGKPSSQADAYLNQLLAERITGYSCEADAGQWMARGSALENEARRWYALQSDTDPVQVGFALDDSRSYGCAPDALVGENGLLEIKCPSAAVHVGYLREGISDKYKPQAQGQLLVTGREWLHLLSYCPGFPPPMNSALVRVERDEEYLDDLKCALTTFCGVLAEEHVRITGASVLASQNLRDSSVHVIETFPVEEQMKLARAKLATLEPAAGKESVAGVAPAGPPMDDAPPVGELAPEVVPQKGDGMFFSASHGKRISIAGEVTKHLENAATKLREALWQSDEDAHGNTNVELIAIETELRRRGK